MCFLFFFFKQKTAYEMRISDWSSDVCSSDLAAIQELMAAGGERRDINRIFFQTFAGHEQHRLILAVEDWYQAIRNQPNFFIQSSLRELRTHQDNDVTPVFVSGSSQEILGPLD